MRSTFLLAVLPALACASPVLLEASCPANLLSCAVPSSNTCCSPTYGIVVLSQQWIPNYGPSDAFTLHGLWPNTCSNGRAPGNGCDDSRRYENIAALVSKAGSLKSEMDTYWPSYTGDNNKFWTHEWGKHGTCVTTLAPKCLTATPYVRGSEIVPYFRKALELRSTYDLYAALARAGIEPTLNRSQGYTVANVEAAVRRAYGKTPELRCKGNVISDINLYFNVRNSDEYVLIDSPKSSSCRGTVILPPKDVSEDVLEEWRGAFGYEWTEAM